MHHSDIKPEVRKLIAGGTVIPAHPLALALDTRHFSVIAPGRNGCRAGGDDALWLPNTPDSRS